MMDRRWLFALLTLALLAGITYYLAREVEEQAQEKPPLARDADFFMERFTVIEMDAAGLPKHRLKADYMKHYPRDDSTELTRPVLTLYQKDGPPWVIVAQRAWVGPHGDLVRLIGAVHMERKKGPHNAPMRVDSHDVLVRPDDEYAQTDAPATLVTDRGVTKGLGVRIYFEDHLIQILSRARGRYEPIPKDPVGPAAGTARQPPVGPLQ